MLSSHLFTSYSCHIFKCFPYTLFASCTVIILCTLFAFIYIFSSFMHLLLLSTCLRLLVLSKFCSLLILFRFPVHLHMTILSHLISCASWSTNYSFAHLPTCHFLLPFLPCYFPGFSFHLIPILFTISMFNFATLLPPLIFFPTLPHPCLCFSNRMRYHF